MVKQEEYRDYVLKKIENSDDDVLTLGGGEPTVHEGFFEFLKEVRERRPDLGMIHVLTNGRRFSDKEFISGFEDSMEPLKFSVSMYGHTPGIHDSITRVDGSFEETVEGLKNILSEGYEADLKFIINRKNFKYIPEMLKFADKNFEGVKDTVLVMPRYVGRAWRNREEIKVSFGKVVPYIEMAYEFFDTDFEVYHLPPCMLKKEVREVAMTGITKYEADGIRFLDRCDDCALRDRCPGIWETYLMLFPDFRPRPVTPDDGHEV